MNTVDRPVAVELFAGAGGMSLGLEQAGFDIVYAADINPYNIAVHRRNFPRCASECIDVSSITGESIRRVAGITGTVDLVSGGPPCQAFSMIGLRREGDVRASLVDEFIRVVNELRPRAFIMENVPGLATGKMRKILGNVVGEFEGTGYTISKPVPVLDAMDFGVPQRRKRLFIIGSINGRPVPVPKKRHPRVTVIDAISDIPSSSEGRAAPYTAAPRSRYAAIARGIETSAGDFSCTRAWNRDECDGCDVPVHSKKTTALYAMTPPGTNVPSHRLYRLDTTGVCPTLRAGSGPGHGSHTAPRPVHPFEPRCITLREAARLHGYPDWFRFYPGKFHGLQQVGNSVCPQVAAAIGASILRHAGIVPSRPGGIIILENTFELPEAREPARRVNRVDNYRLVISWIAGKKRWKFSYNDVLAAMKETGAEIPWIEPGMIVDDILRDRNAGSILEPAAGRRLRKLPPPFEGILEIPATLDSWIP